MINWLRGWYTTIRRRRDHKFLRTYKFDENDFVDAPRPTLHRGKPIDPRRNHQD